MEETEPEWTQSSVRPFYSDYDGPDSPVKLTDFVFLSLLLFTALYSIFLDVEMLDFIICEAISAL